MHRVAKADIAAEALQQHSTKTSEKTHRADPCMTQAMNMQRNKLVMSCARRISQFSRKNVIGWVIACMSLFLVAYGAYSWTEKISISQLRASGLQKLEMYVASLNSTLDKYDYLPKTLELNEDIIRLLMAPGDPKLALPVNQYLEQVNKQAQSTAIYIVDLTGVTRATSNWREKDSFIGDDVSFRPYFQDALKGKPGKFYAVGTTNHEPGYYFAHGIYRNGKMLGVATVKVSIEKLEKTWSQGTDKVLLVDQQGVIFLTSVPAWKYRTLGQSSLDTLDKLSETRQYYEQSLAPLEFVDKRTFRDGSHIISTSGPGMSRPLGSGSSLLTRRRVVSQPDWQFIYLSDLGQATSHARAAAAFSCILFGFFLLLLLYVRQRQHAAAQSVAAKEALQHAYDHLEEMVAERTSELHQTAHNLSLEIDERRHAEQQLHKTQNELIQAGKMAVLGQMSASITHELNQPLTALRTMSDNALILLERGRAKEAKDNLAIISQIVERMGSITGQLKVFARKSTTRLSKVSIRHAIKNALFLVDRRLQLENVTFEQHLPDEDVFALCESNRLEQVLVNLFNNALDSMADSALRRLTVDVLKQKERILIRVHDTGSGISDAVRQHLFEPFFTTKAPGHGLGLGLAISGQIVREFGGTLEAENCFENGAVFTIELRIAQQEVKHV